ncbi:oligosaccharide flippase family protein [Pseudoxanthomonas sp. UTMC 1351]|uniref:oligosaccharide flippase family protein n=1 Tax=Pseudoxanthomonas sp. UTMC 1351 TaxID=2695853 RepID=UPI0034CF1DBC
MRGIGLTDKQKIVSAAAWSIGAGLLGRGVGLVGTLLIARHLSPGIVAEVTVATIIALTGNWISAWGCGQYVIVRGGEGREAIFAASVFYLVFGLMVIAGLWWMAPTLAAWFDTPRLAEYLPGALIGIGIRRLGAIPDKLLARELRFARIALATALGDVAYALVAVTLVSTTQLGGQAMIFGFIAQSCVIAAITIAGTGWRSWLTPVIVSAARFRDIFRFGAPITGEITLSEGARYWDKPLVLRLLGAENAGAYGMAFNLAQLPAIYVGGHIGTVMMPAIVRAQPTDRAPLIVRALGLTAVVLFPMAFGLSVCAPTLVAALLPPEWSQVAPLLSVLAAVSVLAPASFMLASFLGALGENGTALRIELLTVLVLVGALVLLSRWGVVAASFAVGIALVAQLALSIAACRRHGLSLHGLGTPLLRVTAACMVMVAGVLLLRAMMSDWQGAPVLGLVCEIALGAALYPAALAFLGNDLLKDVLRLLSGTGKAELQRTLVASPGVQND